MTETPTKTSKSLSSKRTDRSPANQREKARRNTRLRFEQWAHNPTCEANTVSAVRNVKMADAAKAEGLTPSFGQSPFALARGNTFERGLFNNGAATMTSALVDAGVIPESRAGFLDLRLNSNGGTIDTLDAALDQTRDLLKGLASGSHAPSVVASPALRIPKGVMLPEANLIIDALAIRTDGSRPELIVGEVKTYPDRAGYTSGRELAVARAQAGIYVHALDVVCAELEIADRVDVRRDGFIVLTRPGSNQPSVRAGEDLTYQARRAKRGFELLEAAAEKLPGDLWAKPDEEPSHDLIAAIQEAGTDYGEACLSFCDRAPTCHRAAMAEGDPAVLGDEMGRFLGGVDLNRLLELLDGAATASDVERDLLERIAQSDRSAADE